MTDSLDQRTRQPPRPPRQVTAATAMFLAIAIPWLVLLAAGDRSATPPPSDDFVHHVAPWAFAVGYVILASLLPAGSKIARTVIPRLALLVSLGLTMFVVLVGVGAIRMTSVGAAGFFLVTGALAMILCVPAVIMIYRPASRAFFDEVAAERSRAAAARRQARLGTGGLDGR